MKLKFLSLLLLAYSAIMGQSRPMVMASDSFKFKSFGTDGTTIIIENNTKDRKGSFLRNIDKGITQFAYAFDSVRMVAGGMIMYRGTHDSVFISQGIGGGSSAEIDPIFSASPAAGITSPNISNWNTAFGWGNHALAGYLTGESDPVFSASSAFGITTANISNWNSKLSSETDPIFSSSPALGITSDNISSWNSKEAGLGNPLVNGYILSSTVAGVRTWIAPPSGSGGGAELDPIFSTSPAFGITSPNISNWNTAFAWGNHASAGYLTTESDPVWIAAIANYYYTKVNLQTNGQASVHWNNITNKPTIVSTESDPVWVAAISSYYTKTNLQTNGQASVHWNNITNKPTIVSTENDPVFLASPAAGITSPNISNWNTSFSWGNHASAGYLTTETDPIWSAAITNYYTKTNLQTNGQAAVHWNNITNKPTIISTEIDPVFTASPAAGITSPNISNWNTAFGWGNHASAGYEPGLGNPAANGYILSSTTEGVRTWVASSSGQWTASGSAIYYNNPVWIGAATDNGSGAKLQVTGDATVSNYMYAKKFFTPVNPLVGDAAPTSGTQRFYIPAADPTKGPFGIWFNENIYLDGRQGDTADGGLSLGYNANREKADEPSMYLGMETYFAPFVGSNLKNLEYYLQIQANDGVRHRPYMWVGDRENSTLGLWMFEANNFQYSDRAAVGNEYTYLTYGRNSLSYTSDATSPSITFGREKASSWSAGFILNMQNAGTITNFYTLVGESNIFSGYKYKWVSADAAFDFNYTFNVASGSGGGLLFNVSKGSTNYFYITTSGISTGLSEWKFGDVVSGKPQVVIGGVTYNLGSGIIADNSITNSQLAGSIAASKLVGSDIATVGTIVTGVWNGTPLTSAYLPSTVVYTGQSNTYTAGMKQIFSASATTAGIAFGGVTADPSSPASGDIWFRSDLGKIYYRDGSTSRPLVGEALAQTLTNKTIAFGSNTISTTFAQLNTAVTDADIARTDAANTFTGIQTMVSPSITTPTGIVKNDIGLGNVDNTSNATERAAVATLTNKTINFGSNTISSTIAQLNTAVSDADVATLAGSETLTNKTISFGSNTISSTLAQLNATVSDADVASLAGSETLTNKILAAANNNVEGILVGVRVLSSGTTYTPTSGATKIVVHLIGAGGGGGGSAGVTSGSGAGAGGGAGAYVVKYVTGVSSASTYTIAIGAGGTAGAAATSGTGGTGGSTTFTTLAGSTPASTTITAAGGVGGIGQAAVTTASAVAPALGGSGGTGTNGDVNGAGKPGDYGLHLLAALSISGAGAESTYGFRW